MFIYFDVYLHRERIATIYTCLPLPTQLPMYAVYLQSLLQEYLAYLESFMQDCKFQQFSAILSNIEHILRTYKSPCAVPATDAARAYCSNTSYGLSYNCQSKPWVFLLLKYLDSRYVVAFYIK